MTKPTKWPVCPAKTQISLGIRPVWSESSLSAWRSIGSLANRKVHSEDSDQTESLLGAQVILSVLSCCASCVYTMCKPCLSKYIISFHLHLKKDLQHWRGHISFTKNTCTLKTFGKNIRFYGFLKKLVGHIHVGYPKRHHAVLDPFGGKITFFLTCFVWEAVFGIASSVSIIF